METLEIVQVLRIFILAGAAFVIGMLATPLMTNILYKYKFGKSIRAAEDAPIMSAMHKKKSGTPTMGGVLVWMTVLVMAVLLGGLALLFPETSVARLNFLSRAETLLPLGLMVLGAIVGLFDDVFNINKWGPKGGGLSVRHRLFYYTVLSAIGAWWFYFKLDFTSVHLPFVGDLNLGPFYILFFILVMVATTHSFNITDGLDGLAGGSLIMALSAYLVIAFVLGRFDLAVMLGVFIGALVAFLWFNVHPARFFMGDTGSMSFGFLLATVALLTATALLLIVIGFLYVAETLSVLIQLGSKKIRKKKVFKSAPIHHHFEAIGWPETKIVMRFWIISGIGAVCGLVLFLLDRGFTV